MAIAELIDALERDGEAERAALRAAAEAEAEAACAEAARRRADWRRAELDSFRAERRRDAEAVIADAARRWRGAELSARAAALDRLYRATEAALPARLADPAVVGALIDAALAAIGDRAATVRGPAALVPALRARAAERPLLAIAVDDTAGTGVRAELAGGAIAVDATLETALARAWPRLRQRALAGERP